MLEFQQESISLGKMILYWRNRHLSCYDRHRKVSESCKKYYVSITGAIDKS